MQGTKGHIDHMKKHIQCGNIPFLVRLEIGDIGIEVLYFFFPN